MPSNSERAARGGRALGHYLIDRDTSNDDEADCTDLVVDIMHMLHIDVPGFDGERFIHRVLDHYLTELFEEEGSLLLGRERVLAQQLRRSKG